jgi:hypothetical protein
VYGWFLTEAESVAECFGVVFIFGDSLSAGHAG